MKNASQFIKAFILILFSVTFIALFSFSGGKAIDTFFSTQKQFPEGTFIGSVPISGLYREEAEEILATEVEKWQRSTVYKLVFFDEVVEISATNVQFFISETLQNVEQGHKDILNTISDTVIEEAIDQLTYSIQQERLQMDSISEVVKFHAGNLSSTPLFINVNEHLKNPYTIGRVSEANISNIESTLLLDQWAKNLNGYVIEGRETFSLLEAMKEVGSVVVEAESLHVLASSVYETFLKTNFNITERHIGQTLPDFAELGFHAVVIPGSLDFKVENPNYYPYTLLLSYENNQLTVVLEGVSFPHSYTIATKNERNIEPRKVVHFSKDLRSGASRIIETGRNGYFIEVYRQKRSETNELISEQLLFEDFYSPVHLVELRSAQDRTINEGHRNGRSEGDGGGGENGDEPSTPPPPPTPNGDTINERKEDEDIDNDSDDVEVPQPNEEDIDDEDVPVEPTEPTKGY